MKRFLTIGFVLHVLVAGAQWSADPAAPLSLYNTNTMILWPRALDDGSGGWYVIWQEEDDDYVLNIIRGQRVDADGHLLWGAAGKVLVHEPGFVVYDIWPSVMADGSIMIAYGKFNDDATMVRISRFGQDGEPLWAQPRTLMAKGDDSPIGTVHEVGYPHVVPSGDGAMALWVAGGMYVESPHVFYPDYFFYEKMSLDGTTLFSGHTQEMDDPNEHFLDPVPLPDQSGGLVAFSLTVDHDLMAMHVTGTGTVAWGMDSLTNLNFPDVYGYGFLSDGNGSYFASYCSQWDIYTLKLQTDGSVPWIRQVCGADHEQVQPVMVMNDGYLYVAWMDLGPPTNTAGLYVQKLDMDGDPQWAGDGIEVFRYPADVWEDTFQPALVAGEDGSVFAALNMSSQQSAMVQRILADGTLAWDQPVAINQTIWMGGPKDFVHVPDGAGGMVSFWEEGFHIYGARLDANGLMVGIEEQAEALGRLHIQPSPTDGPVTVGLPNGQTVRSTQVFNAEGRAIELPVRFGHGRIDMDASGLPNGIYLVQVATDKGLMTGRFAVAH